MNTLASQPAESLPTDPSDRLTGWKEIAVYLGKGVRTAQRWEASLGLPVHRVGKEGGEIVFAFRSEIARWQAVHELTRKAPRRAGPAIGTPPAAPKVVGWGHPIGAGATAPASAARRRAALHAAVGAVGAAAVMLCLWLLTGGLAR